MVNVLLIVAAYFPARYFYDGSNPIFAAVGAVIVVGLLITKVFLDR
jgi:hypothetical protein